MSQMRSVSLEISVLQTSFWSFGDRLQTPQRLHLVVQQASFTKEGGLHFIEWLVASFEQASFGFGFISQKMRLVGLAFLEPEGSQPLVRASMRSPFSGCMVGFPLHERVSHHLRAESTAINFRLYKLYLIEIKLSTLRKMALINGHFRPKTASLRSGFWNFEFSKMETLKFHQTIYFHNLHLSHQSLEVSQNYLEHHQIIYIKHVRRQANTLK